MHFLSYWHNGKGWALKHKKMSGVIAVVILLGGYWLGGKIFSTAGETRYVVAAVEKGTLVVSITGTGQVSASNQVDLKPKVSGDITAINVVSGQEVKAGVVLAQIDAREALKSVRDAAANWQSAKLSLEKLQQPADSLSLVQAENALVGAEQAKVKAESDLVKAYDDAFTAVSNAFLDLPAVVTGLQDVLYKTSYASGQENLSYYNDLVKPLDERVTIYRNNAAETYQVARAAYDKNFLDYKEASRYADNATREALLQETYNTTKAVSEAVKSTDNLLSFVKDRLNDKGATIPSTLTTHKTSTAGFTSTANSHLVNLLSSSNAIKNYQETIASSGRTITEKTASLEKLKAGTAALDLQSAQLSLTQRANALQDAREKLADYSLRAPFAGVVAKVSAKRGDAAASGTAVATLITKQKIAEISLNEVDVSKVKTGQKSNLTFDAVAGLTISGAVISVDTVGTVSQGVVSYAVKIGFDTEDDRVKPGMSVSAAIITEVKTDVLMVANSAVKSAGENYYVEKFAAALPAAAAGVIGSPSATLPEQQSVTIGAANDNYTEIVSGLNEGEEVVVRTIAATTKTTTGATSNNKTSGGGMGMVGGFAH